MWGTRGALAPTINRLAAGACAVAVVAGAGCARPADVDLTAAPEAGAPSELLVAAAERSGAEAYRYDMEMSIWAIDPGGGLVMGLSMTGVVDGDRQSSSMDAGDMFAAIPGALPPELSGADLTTETVVDGETMYIRAPLFAALAEMLEGQGMPRAELGPMAALADLGDAWGRVDLGQLAGGFSLGEVVGGGQSTPDPAAFLQMVAEAEDPKALGAGEARGVPVEGTAATVTFRDFMVLGGSDPDDLAAPFGDEIPGDELDEALEAMLATPLPVEVWVDAEGYVRQVVVDVDLGDIARRFDDTGAADVPKTRITLDFFDYGDDSIEVAIPPDSVDVTDEFRTLVEGGGFTPGGDFATS